MDQTPIGYTYWQQPPSNSMPDVLEVANAAERRPPARRGSHRASHPRAGSETGAPKSWRGFVEADGYVSMEAEHFTRKTATAAAHWEVLPDHGRTLSAMTIFPVTAPSVLPPQDSPCLEYAMWLVSTGALECRGASKTGQVV